MKRMILVVAVCAALAVSSRAGGAGIASAAVTPAVLAADTPSTTAAGVTFTAPKDWSLRRAASVNVVTAPEGDLSVALVDVGPASDASAAVARAWQLYPAILIKSK